MRRPPTEKGIMVSLPDAKSTGHWEIKMLHTSRPIHLVTASVHSVGVGVAGALAVGAGEAVGGHLLARGRPRVAVDEARAVAVGGAAACVGDVGDVLFRRLEKARERGVGERETYGWAVVDVEVTRGLGHAPVVGVAVEACAAEVLVCDAR